MLSNNVISKLRVEIDTVEFTKVKQYYSSLEKYKNSVVSLKNVIIYYRNVEFFFIKFDIKKKNL